MCSSPCGMLTTVLFTEGLGKACTNQGLRRRWGKMGGRALKNYPCLRVFLAQKTTIWKSCSCIWRNPADKMEVKELQAAISDSWRRQQQPTPVFLPGESHGQRSLAGYSPRGCKESDTTEYTHISVSDSVLNIMCDVEGSDQPLCIHFFIMKWVK